MVYGDNNPNHKNVGYRRITLNPIDLHLPPEQGKIIQKDFGWALGLNGYLYMFTLNVSYEDLCTRWKAGKWKIHKIMDSKKIRIWHITYAGFSCVFDVLELFWIKINVFQSCQPHLEIRRESIELWVLWMFLNEISQTIKKPNWKIPVFCMTKHWKANETD